MSTAGLPSFEDLILQANDVNETVPIDFTTNCTPSMRTEIEFSVEPCTNRQQLSLVSPLLNIKCEIWNKLRNGHHSCS